MRFCMENTFKVPEGFRGSSGIGSGRPADSWLGALEGVGVIFKVLPKLPLRMPSLFPETGGKKLVPKPPRSTVRGVRVAAKPTRGEKLLKGIDTPPRFVVASLLAPL